MSQDPQNPERKLKPRIISNRARYVRAAAKSFKDPTALARAAGLPPSTILRVTGAPARNPNISTLGAVRATTKIPFPPDLQNELAKALDRRGFGEAMIMNFMATGELPEGVKIQSTGRGHKSAKRELAVRTLNDRAMSIELPEGTVTIMGPPTLSPKSLKVLDGWLAVVVDTFTAHPEAEEEEEDGEEQAEG